MPLCQYSEFFTGSFHINFTCYVCKISHEFYLLKSSDGRFTVNE